MRKIFGYLLIVWANVFCVLETHYFGMKLLPSNYFELICDISVLLMLISGVILTIKR